MICKASGITLMHGEDGPCVSVDLYELGDYWVAVAATDEDGEVAWSRSRVRSATRILHMATWDTCKRGIFFIRKIMAQANPALLQYMQG